MEKCLLCQPFGLEDQEIVFENKTEFAPGSKAPPTNALKMYKKLCSCRNTALALPRDL